VPKLDVQLAAKELPTHYELMQPGEQYLLFLSDDDRPNLSDRGMPRQIITGGWMGMFRIDNDKVHPTQSVLQQRYEAIPLAELLVDIMRSVQATNGAR
jgi:hypothetical protein